jgi:putative transcriptional regulator
MIIPGTILISSPSLDDPNFHHAVIFITQYDLNGAAGFIINHPFNRTLNELAEFSHSLPFPLYAGGPVEKEQLFFLHRRPGIIEGSLPINNSIFLNGNFKDAVTQINNKKITNADIKIFIGYCGWDAGELEAEIAEESWTIVGADVDIFSDDVLTVWEEFYQI